MLTARPVPTRAEIRQACRRQNARFLLRAVEGIGGAPPPRDVGVQRALLATDTPELAGGDEACISRWCEAFGLEPYNGRVGEELDCQVPSVVVSELWWELLMTAVPEAAILVGLLSDLAGRRELESLAESEMEDLLAVRRSLYAVAATFACERGEKVPLVQGAVLGDKG